MSAAYVDTSCLVAIAFAVPGWQDVARTLRRHDRLFSSNLLDAELRAALSREGAPPDVELLSWIRWVLPDRPLSAEIARVLETGHARGADLWHLASALYLAERPERLAFLTLDSRQAELAERLGFTR